MNLTLRNGRPGRIPFLEFPSSSQENCTWMGKESPGLKLQCKDIAFVFLKDPWQENILLQGLRELKRQPHNNIRHREDLFSQTKHEWSDKKDLTAGAARAEPGSVVCSTLTPASRNLRFEIHCATILSKLQLDDCFKRIENPSTSKKISETLLWLDIRRRQNEQL